MLSKIFIDIIENLNKLGTILLSDNDGEFFSAETINGTVRWKGLMNVWL
nr:hypothetical protein [Lactobacillus amylovorus]